MYCAIFGKSNHTKFNFDEPICNTPLCYVGYGVTEDDCIDNSQGNDYILWATHEKYAQMRTKKQYNDI